MPRSKITTGEIPVCPHCREAIELVGTKEASEVLGVSPSSFQNYKATETFPKPWAVLGQGALWLRGEVLEWKSSREEKTVSKFVEGLEAALAGMSERERQNVLKRLAGTK